MSGPWWAGILCIVAGLVTALVAWAEWVEDYYRGFDGLGPGSTVFGLIALFLVVSGIVVVV